MKIDAKRVPKGSQNRCQNASKISVKIGREKGEENHEKSCFFDMAKVVNLWNCTIQNVFWPFQCAGRKIIKNEVKIHAKIDGKSMLNLGMKNDAKMTENGAKMEPQGEPK